ncbi:hypothetical protein NUW54_g8390 [Trametes sanguinea]|uniref:Uncharacterized protein n=1 Tax=Trametes sanguinea TaxID=158606 RepID=A0ACC1PFE2_9APHY|nr:hypothetical protein NUW54_g8390 [Trametes sanguinea]
MNGLWLCLTRNLWTSLNDLASARGQPVGRAEEGKDGLYEAIDGCLELDADLIARLGDLLADGDEDGGATLGEAEACQSVDLQGRATRDETHGEKKAEGACGLFEADDGAKAEDVDAELKELVGGLACEAEDG